MAMILDISDFCRLCEESCRLNGTLSNTKQIWDSKDPNNVTRRLLKIGLILQPRDKKSSRICRKCFRLISRMEESLSTLQKWKLAEETGFAPVEQDTQERELNQSITPLEIKEETHLTPIPKHSLATTQSQSLTEVTIPYPAEHLALLQIMPTSVSGIFESLCKGHWAKLAKLIMDHDVIAEKIKACVLADLDKECKTLCYPEQQDCMLWRCSPEDLMAFSFADMESNLQRLAPLLFSLLSTVTKHSALHTCAAASIALRGRNPQLSAFAYYVNGILLQGGAKKAIYQRLCKFGISTSYNNAVKKLHSLAKESSEALENQGHCISQTEEIPPVEYASESEEGPSSDRSNTEEFSFSEVCSESGEMPSGQLDHALRVMSSLNQQREAGSFCDAVLNVGNGSVYTAHRNILACFSDLVQGSNASAPASANAPCVVELHLRGCPSDGLELLLDFVYTGELKLNPDNLDKVQDAAVSLCVPEAITLCQQFKECSTGQVPFKRKRGRPKKSTSDAIKEENFNTSSKDEHSHDTATANFSTATNTSHTSTTTRSGRVVKGPRRLVTDEKPTADCKASEKADKKSSVTLTEGESVDGAMENADQDRPIGETKEFLSSVNDNVAGEGTEEVDDGNDDVGSFEAAPIETDEEYVPVNEPASSGTSMSASRKRKAQPSKPDKDENGEAVEEDSKKDCVQCPTCAKSFKSKYYLKVHNRRHTGERPFGCVKCGKRYFRKENLLMHEIRDCSVVQTFPCTTCSKTFKVKEELHRHIVTHTGEMPHKCLMCPEQFMYKKHLTGHMMKSHGHPKPHACPQCPKSFLTRTELRVHEAAKHRGEKPFVCEECGHRASSRNGLQMHIKAIHRNERPFVCTICGHAFSQKNNLNMHLRIHSGERPFQCHLCGKTFRTQASLDKHNRTHTGERPFGCDVCEQRFTEKGALVRHKASKHEEGRPHCCHICGKTFKAMEQLRVHLRRHKGMRKFECVDCGYKFTRQAHLRRHTQIHKRTENYNPRQRKLRNLIVQEVGQSPDDNEEEPAAAAEASPDADDVPDYAPETADVQEPPKTIPVAGLASPGCEVRAAMDSTSAALEHVVSEQNLEQVENAESFSVPDILQPAQLVNEAFESTVDMDGIVENISGSKS